LSHFTDGMLPVLDFESTGTDPLTARPVSVAYMIVKPDGSMHRDSLYEIIKPDGFEVPEEAAAVHGITTDRALAEGKPAKDVFAQLMHLYRRTVERGLPLVIFNARYDWPMLRAEYARLYGEQLAQRPVIVDPLVISREMNRYKKGGHKLETIAAEFGYTFEAHDAKADCLATAFICRALFRKYWARLGSLADHELHDFQVNAHERWRKNMNEYFVKIKSTNHIPPERWPEAG
jgi:DNA polymerase-3 subunit epsilon